MAETIRLTSADITQHEIDAVVELLRLSAFTGERVAAFERAAAAAAGRQHAVASSSGTTALHLALLAAGVGAEDEVVTSPFSSVATANSIITVNAKPVFVDIHPKTLNLDLTKLQQALTSKTRAILASETIGHPAGMSELENFARRNEIVLIENASEGFGGKTSGRAVGSFGRASAFSFHLSKQITSGEGGMLVTDDDRLADAARMLRNHGRDGSDWPAFRALGYSYRMSELEAALGLAQLQRITEITEKRRKVASEYFDRLMENRYATLPTVPEDTTMCWGAFPIRLNDLFEPGDRDQIMHLMAAEGIETGRLFAPLHMQPHIAEKTRSRRGDFPVTEYFAERTLSLPMHCRLTPADVERVCEVLDLAIEKVLMGRCKSRF